MGKTELIAGAVIAGVVLYLWMDVKKGAAAVAKGINPADSENVVNKGVTAIGKAVTGDKGWSLGGMIYDWTHPEYANLGKGGKL